MEHIGAFVQLIFVIAIAVFSILNKKNKAEKNSWGKDPKTIFDIFSSSVNSNRIRVKAKLRAKIELYAYDLYIYVRNNGSMVAKNVILHSKEIEPIDVSDDKENLDIQPGEEIGFFMNSFEFKKISRVTVSWHDDTGFHKRPFLVKQKSSIN